MVDTPAPADNSVGSETAARVFLCGDVMTGRGIDQILSSPGNPTLHEPSVHDATAYVFLAEAVNGQIPRRAPASYLWGDALRELDRAAPDVRLINLETAVTVSRDYDRDKSIHYRMHPANVGCLTAAGIHCCGLANNHVLDWGRAGLQETLSTLSRAGIATAGAGRDSDEAMRPAVFELPGRGRVLIFACGCESSGVAADWAAGNRRSGVWLIDEGSPESVSQIAEIVRTEKRPGDLVILSIHWGSNWGYYVPADQRKLAHGVIDSAGIDVVCGHSSHHVKGIEVYRGRPIFYGCGDLLTDYEGIGGREEYRPDLGLLYFVTLDLTTGELLRIEMTPTQLKRFRLMRPGDAEAGWLAGTLDRECRRLGTRIEVQADGRMALHWQD